MLRSALWLTVTLLITVINVNTLRPLVFLRQDGKVCCLECKKNFCPMIKKTAEGMPSCHISQQTHQSKMNKSCNHSNNEHLFYYDAILVSIRFITNYSIENTFTVSFKKIILLGFQPTTPPPRVA